MRSLNLVFLVALVVLAAKFSLKQTDGFSVLGISSARPFNPDWETELIDREKIDEALSQPYEYLGSGSQCFVFASQDGQYVIKFFKQRIYTPSVFLNGCPLPWFLQHYREKRNWKRLDKCKRDFESYKMAYENLKEETQLLAVHLNPTECFKKKVLISDRLHIKHLIDLDKTNFILQRKAEPAFAHIGRLMEEGKKNEAKKAVISLQNLIERRCAKGYKDRDPDIRTNCGFVDGKAMKLDVGRLEKDERFKEFEYAETERKKIMAPFLTWIETFYPDLYANSN